eukprot:403353157
MQDRKKRTYQILKKFDPQLANEVIYKENREQNNSNKIDQIIVKLIQASIIIQKHFRAWKAKQVYNQLIYEKYEEFQRQQDLENEKLIEQWAREQETSRLQKEINEKNNLFKYQIQERKNAAIVIQKAVRYFFRKKNLGISYYQNLQKQELAELLKNDEDFKDYTQMDISIQLSKKQQDKRSRASPKSLGPNRISRGHLFNRIRQLQIETSNKSMIEQDSLDQSKSPINTKFQGSTTPIDLSNSQQIISGKQLNKSFQGVRTGDIEELKYAINQVNKRKGSNQLEKTQNLNHQRRQEQQESLILEKDQQEYTLLKALSNNQDAQQTNKSLFSLGTSSGKLQDAIINLHSGSGGDHDLTSQSPYMLQQNLLSFGTSGLNQDIHNLDNSISNLFDSLRQPPKQFQNNFDLTQKLQENFNHLLSKCETIEELDSLATPLPSQQFDNQIYQGSIKKSKRIKKQQSNKQSEDFQNNGNQRNYQNNGKVKHSSKPSVVQIQNRSIYDQFLRDESIKETHLNSDDITPILNEQPIPNFINHQSSVIEMINSSQYHLLNQIQDETLSEEDDDLILNSLEDNYRLGSVQGKYSKNQEKQLNENDFPMTQLIKERTIQYHNESIASVQDFQTNHTKPIQETQQEQFHENKVQESSNNYNMNERYSYFQQLINTFNEKQGYLEGLQVKRDDLVYKIMFHQNILSNLNHMVKTANPRQSQKKQSDILKQQAEQIKEQKHINIVNINQQRLYQQQQIDIIKPTDPNTNVIIQNHQKKQYLKKNLAINPITNAKSQSISNQHTARGNSKPKNEQRRLSQKPVSKDRQK